MNWENEMVQQEKQLIKGNYEITLNTLPELLELVEDNWESKTPFRIVTFNPEMLVKSEGDAVFKAAVHSAEAIIPDGIGLVLLLKKYVTKKVKRQPGIELAWEALKLAVKDQLPLALIGSTDKALQGTLHKIQSEIGRPNLIYSRNGFFAEEEDAQIINLLLELQPSLLLVAMPFTRQEVFLHKAFQRGLKSVAIGIGGSFDVWAGHVTRAPVLFQKIGLEWLWRILLQPVRFQRILQTLIPFTKFYLSANP